KMSAYRANSLDVICESSFDTTDLKAAGAVPAPKSRRNIAVTHAGFWREEFLPSPESRIRRGFQQSVQSTNHLNAFHESDMVCRIVIIRGKSFIVAVVLLAAGIA